MFRLSAGDYRHFKCATKVAFCSSDIKCKGIRKPVVACLMMFVGCSLMLSFGFAALPHHRKAPKERSGTALVSALDGGDVTIDGQAAAIGAMPSPGSLEPPEGQNRSSHETSSIAPVADETGLQGSSSGVQAGVSDPESANNSHAELNKQLADLTRKYSKLQELQTQANSTIQGFRKKVKKLESTIETLEKNMKFLNEDQIQALSRNSN